LIFGSSHASPAVIAFTPRGHPVLGPWRAALSAHLPVEGVWGADAADLRRFVSGLAPAERPAPRLVPLCPWGEAWRPAHARWLRRRWPDARAVVFTLPDQAPLLPFFSDRRRLYYVIDDYAAYGRDCAAPERALLTHADHIVCVSSRLADALAARVPLAAGKLTVLPNAIPAAWLPSAPPAQPCALPENLSLPRPLVGVLGRVSSRLRLDWLLDTIEREPAFHWLFVGDIEWSEVTAEDRPRLARLRRHPRCTLLGARPFATMRAFAAALDVAVLPYSERSTNPHGSAVRLFVHLPWAAPLLATPGCHQVADFGPLVTLCTSPAALATALADMRPRGCDDGLRAARWQAAHAHTWEARAAAWLPLLGTSSPRG
jgi:glycosyltransferase involved in cell wall biosynthesis